MRLKITSQSLSYIYQGKDQFLNQGVIEFDTLQYSTNEIDLLLLPFCYKNCIDLISIGGQVDYQGIIWP